VIVVEAYPFVARKVARVLRQLDDLSAQAVAIELASLPTLEASNRLAPIRDLPTGYKALALPSGYLVLYRRMTPVEIKDVTGDYVDRDAYLVADLVRLFDDPAGDNERTETSALPE
jgi:hypothetical protein